VDEALQRLAEQDPRSAKLVELRYFGGMTIDESARLLDISVATAKRDWALAPSVAAESPRLRAA